MKDYYPDRWFIVKINSEIYDKTFYKVFAVWVGGYAQGDSWRMSSGIKEVIDHETGYEFKNESGSSYFCSKNSYGTSAYGQGILRRIFETAVDAQSTIEVVPEDTNFMELKYE